VEKNLVGYKRELQEYMDSLTGDWENEFDKVFNLARKFFHAQEYANSVKYYDKAIALNPDYAPLYNNKAAALSKLGKRRDLISLCLETLKLNENDSIAFSNLFREAEWQKKLKQTIPQIVNKPDTYDYKIRYIVRYADSVATPYKAKYFQVFDDMGICNRCGDYEEYFWVKYIFERTEENTFIRAYLIAFCAAILEIKRNLIFKDLETKPIGHYTRVETIRHLVVKESGDRNKFRLNNVAYMNDPSEGHVFLDILSHVLKDQTLSNYYSLANGKEGRQPINDSDTYLGSFSTNVDSLPLWVQYGNNGQGCCLIFNSSCFDKEEPITPEQIRMQPQPQTEIEYTEKEEKTVAPKYCLYRVIYTDSIEDLKETTIYAPLEKVSKLLSHIDREMKKVSDSSVREDLRRIVINAIDQIRFLFKNTDYVHEHELRIVISSYDPKEDEGNRPREIPHMYVEMDKELEYDEIILGPKVEKPSEVAPYVYYTKKVKAVTKSSIKYQ